MILTRSIRRKLLIGLVVVFAMVLLLSIAGLSALYSYQHVVDNLRYSQKNEPRPAELAVAVIGLLDAFSYPSYERKEGENGRQTASQSSLPTKSLDVGDPKLDEFLWDEKYKSLLLELSNYCRRIDVESTSKSIGGRSSITSNLLIDIKSKQRRLEEKRRWLDSYDDRPELVKSMQIEVNELLSCISRLPVPDSIVEQILRDSWDVIENRLWLIGVPTTIVVVLFFSLIYFGNHWILIPIRQLHEAASRVANGNYTYRLKLYGRDEMAELGKMFNKMTERFQTDKAKLDQEVEQRSRQLLRNERLAGIGFFASGVAHEINNPLQAIGAAAESLSSRLSEGSMGQELPQGDRELLATYLSMIERESTRCQQITSRVLDFARGTNGPKMRQDLTKIVVEVLEMVSHMSKFDGRKIIFDRNESHFVDLSTAEMKQVVLNLVANGLEAMKDSGTMTIRIDETIDEVVLSITDDGCGMTAEVIENLYEPFFTEKLDGKGTGLGLSITHRIVGDHGGRIEATSEGPGRGSTFRVHLPRCAKATKTAAA